MARHFSQRAVTPLLIFLYVAALVPSTSCFGERAPSHVHHPSPAAGHDSGCFLACETAVAEKTLPFLPHFLFLIFAFTIIFPVFIRLEQFPWDNRAPPLV